MIRLRSISMNIQIAKTDYKALLDLTEKCVVFVQGHNPTLKEYNQARRLRLVMKKIINKNKDIEL